MQVARGGKRGKTSGRGGKGQTARAGNKRRPEWRDIIKKLPKLRGRGKNSNKTVKNIFQVPVVVNLFRLEEIYNSGEIVNPTSLLEKGLISTWSGRMPMVKILGSGELKKSIKIENCYISDSAKEAVLKAGGEVKALVSKSSQEVEKKDAVEVKSEKNDKKTEPKKKAEPKSAPTKKTEVKKTEKNVKPKK